jgi:hypothetical protein
MDQSVACGLFVSRAAAQNSLDVIQAILTSQNGFCVEVYEFFDFMLSFGPRETAMLKFHSLVEAATTME